MSAKQSRNETYLHENQLTFLPALVMSARLQADAFADKAGSFFCWLFVEHVFETVYVRCGIVRNDAHNAVFSRVKHVYNLGTAKTIPVSQM